MKAIVTFAALTFAALASTPAQAQKTTFYDYAHNDAEYSVPLPEAPQVVTIWGDGTSPVPYLENPPKEGALGEIALVRRVDPKAEDLFEAKVTFLKSGPDFLKSLDEAKIKTALENDYRAENLQEPQWHYSAAPTGLKWATLSGFSVDQQSRPLYHASHYLTGRQSIMIVRVKYSVENTEFVDHYKKLMTGITYLAP